jgi:hypothetical protein
LLMTCLMAGLLCACRMSPRPLVRPNSATPTPRQLAPAPATGIPPTGAVLPSATAIWGDQETEDLAIRLPGGWRAGMPELASENIPAFQRADPELARLLEGADTHVEAVFSSPRDATAPEAFADNLIIRRALSGGQEKADVPEIVATVAAQYRRLGFDAVETTAGLEIGGLPAALIAYTFWVAAQDGSRAAVGGLQVFVAAPADLWILTYTTKRDRFATLRPVFEQSARSFRVRS